MAGQPLSDDARGYINQLSSEHLRGEARGWASMDPQLFQAKIGTAIEEIDAKLAEMLARSRRQPGLPQWFADLDVKAKVTIVSAIGSVVVYVLANWPG